MTKIMPIQNRVSIRDIATRLNLSHGTVSMALRDISKVSRATRDRVRKEADEMGYVPDPSLAALASYRNTKKSARYQSTLCWLNTWPDRATYDSFAEYVAYRDGALAEAKRLGYELETFDFLPLETSQKRFFNILRSRGIRGIVIPPVGKGSIKFEDDFSNFSTISIGSSLRRHTFHSVATDQFQAGFDAYGKLLQMGFKKIGFVISENQDERSFFRYRSGVRMAQEVNNPKAALPMIRLGNDSDTARAQFLAWKKEAKPDAMLQADGRIMDWVDDREGIASIGLLDNGPVLYGIDQKSEVIGRTAISLLSGMLHRNEVGVPDAPVRAVIRGSWQVAEDHSN